MLFDRVSNHNRQSEEKKITAWSAGKHGGDQVMIGFSFVSDWLREKREFSGTITKHIVIPDYLRRSIENCSKLIRVYDRPDTVEPPISSLKNSAL